MRRWFSIPAALAVVSLFAASSQAQTGLYFSEYVEGSSFNKCVEVYNGTGADVDLSLIGLELYSNGSATATSTQASLGLGVLGAGDVFVVCNPSIAPAPAALDLLSGTVNFNGDDAFVLTYEGAAVDVIGQIGVDPGSAWGVAPVTTVNATLRRLVTVCEGDTDGTDAYDPATEWEGFPIDDLSGLGSHTGCTPVSSDEQSWSAVKARF